MKLHRFDLAAILPFLFAVSLSAQPAHTWVSATGSDIVGTIGTTAKPFATFQAAIDNTAAGGIVSVLGPGDYGPVTITKSITIDGTGGGSITWSGPFRGVYINPAGPATVVLRNLSIDGGGTGADAILIASAGTANLVNVVIDGCHLEGFMQRGVGLGSESPMYVTIKNTTIQGGDWGVRALGNGTAPPVTAYSHLSLDHVTIQGAAEIGVLTQNGNLDISNSNISGSVGTSAAGIAAEDYATVNVQSTMVTSNTNGVCIVTNSTAVLGTSTTVADNTTNIENCGGVVQGNAGAGPSPRI
jgi:hypothetical protein